jgi:diguanylate cyclase (GGDEF)-like protein
LAAVGGAAVVTLVAAPLGLAARLGRWFATSDPLVANVVLFVLVVPPIAWALIAGIRARRAAGAQRELSRLSRHDPLTGLPNRAALPDLVNRGLRTANHSTVQCAALFCDLDRFKLVNDTYGHEVGDRLMVSVADRLKTVCGGTGWAVRYGGDEFVVVQPVSGKSEAERIAHRLVAALEAPFEIGTDTMRISVSIGVALSDATTATADDLLRDADVAMYQAKANGAGAVCVYDQSMRSGLSRANAEARLRAALDKGEIQLRYEPVLTVRDGSLAAVRVCLQWHDPLRGIVPTREFTPALEETGLILEVGTWALSEACNHARRWRALAPDRPAVQVVVPITARQLAQANFRDLVAAILKNTGLERTQLCLAISDSSLIDDITDAWTMLRHARTLGVQVALDGFGAEGASLADLRRVRIDQLWLDNDLIAGLGVENDDTVIAAHLVEMARGLNLVTVATNVDSATQLALLRQLHCERAQGPFLGMPLTRDEIDLLVTPSPGVEEMSLAAEPPPEPVAVTSAPAHTTISGLPRLKAFGSP